MNATAPPLDIVAVLTLLVAAVSGQPVLAQIVAPYAVIVMCALLGASVSSSGWKVEGRWMRLRTFVYIVALTVSAVVITVPLSEMAAPHLDGHPPRWLFGPLAGLIGLAPLLSEFNWRPALRALQRLSIRAALRWLAVRLSTFADKEGP